MLSLAYGDDQRSDLTAHKPEVCYPAQGFQLHSNSEDELTTPFGRIAVRRLNTSLGARREPVTYWFTVGDRAIRSKFDQRIVEVRLGLTGQIPDGCCSGCRRSTRCRHEPMPSRTSSSPRC